MGAKPRIAIVGVGNLGSALASALRRAGYAVELVKKSRVACASFTVRSEVVWFCVPDGEIARAAVAWAEKIEWKGRVALHSSGTLSSDELDVLRRKGAAVASVHPLMTFVRGSQPTLAAVSFVIEGDAAAGRMARRIVKDLGGRAYSIRKEDKAAYHAWSTFSSPLLTGLLATTEHVAALAGIEGKAARLRMMPILQQTLANYAAFGAAHGFSGPIIRGDVETVKSHLRVLEKIPVTREVYVALARAALHYLPAKKKASLHKLLASHQR